MAPAAADSASEAANPDSAVKKEPSAERNVLPDSTEDAVVAKPKVCPGGPQEPDLRHAPKK